MIPESGRARLRPQLPPQGRGRLIVDLEGYRVHEDDPIGVPRELDRRELVEYVLTDKLGISLERIAVPSGVRNLDLKPVTGPEANTGHESRQRFLRRETWVLGHRPGQPL